VSKSVFTAVATNIQHYLIRHWTVLAIGRSPTAAHDIPHSPTPTVDTIFLCFSRFLQWRRKRAREQRRRALKYTLELLLKMTEPVNAYSPGALLGAWARPAPTPNKLLAGHLANPGLFFSKLQIAQQPHNRENIRDSSIIDNSKAYMSI
jgi:hypothetical protein